MNRIRKIMAAEEEKVENFSAPEDLEIKEPSTEEARQLVGNVRTQTEGLVNQFHMLFESLNQLAEGYPGLYDELKLAVKFPNEKDAQDIAKMRDTLEDVAGHYEDEAYLSGIIGVKEEG